jgi:hypothetical protein
MRCDTIENFSKQKILQVLMHRSISGMKNQFCKILRKVTSALSFGFEALRQNQRTRRCRDDLLLFIRFFQAVT